MRTVRIHSLSNFHTYHTAVLTIVILYHTSPVLIFLVTGTLYILTTFIQFPHLLLPQDFVFLENKSKKLLSRLDHVRMMLGIGCAAWKLSWARGVLCPILSVSVAFWQLSRMIIEYFIFFSIWKIKQGFHGCCINTRLDSGRLRATVKSWGNAERRKKEIMITSASPPRYNHC